METFDMKNKSTKTLKICKKKFLFIYYQKKKKENKSETMFSKQFWWFLTQKVQITVQSCFTINRSFLLLKLPLLFTIHLSCMSLSSK